MFCGRSGSECAQLFFCPLVPSPRSCGHERPAPHHSRLGVGGLGLGRVFRKLPPQSAAFFFHGRLPEPRPHPARCPASAFAFSRSRPCPSPAALRVSARRLASLIPSRPRKFLGTPLACGSFTLFSLALVILEAGSGGLSRGDPGVRTRKAPSEA